MKKTLYFFAVAALAGATVWWMRGPAAAPAVAREMPAFEATDLDGRLIRSGDLRGGLAMISVFERNCGSCSREVEHLNELQKLYPEVRMIAMTFETTAAARQFKEQHGLQWRVLPSQGEFISRAGVPGSPAQLFYDSRGRLLGHRLGWPVEESRQAEARAGMDAWMSDMLSQGKTGSPS
jgi:peroxiredoxin